MIEWGECASYNMERKKDLLIKIDNAIDAILMGAQSYQIGSQTLTRANLNELWKMRKALESELNVIDSEDASLLSKTRVAYMDRR